MPRPRKFRHINFNPSVRFFKPPGIPLQQLLEVSLERDEIEVIRLCDHLDYDMITAAEQMKISKSTIHRLLQSAHHKIAEALIEGKAIKIEGRIKEKS